MLKELLEELVTVEDEIIDRGCRLGFSAPVCRKSATCLPFEEAIFGYG
jgi:hypothetical protein